MDIIINPQFERELNQMNMHVLSLAYAKLNREWNCPDARFPFTRIYYITSGKGYIKCQDQVTELLPGNIYILPAGLEFSYWCEDHLEKFFAHINILKQDNYDILSEYQKCIILPHKEQEIETIVNYWNRGDLMSVMAIKTHMYQMILEGIGQEQLSLGEIPEYGKVVSEAIGIIEQNLRANLTAQELADLLFVSKSQLQREFREEVKVPLGKYINDRLMYAAEQKLRRKDETIKEISDSLGFCDQFYFSRRFSEQFGVSPNRYRKNMT